MPHLIKLTFAGMEVHQMHLLTHIDSMSLKYVSSTVVQDPEDVELERPDMNDLLTPLALSNPGPFPSVPTIDHVLAPCQSLIPLPWTSIPNLQSLRINVRNPAHTDSSPVHFEDYFKPIFENLGLIGNGPAPIPCLSSLWISYDCRLAYS